MSQSASSCSRSRRVPWPCADPAQEPVHLHGARAAGDALAARFVHAELHEEPGDVDHVGVWSMTIMPPEPMIEPSRDERLVIDRRVEVLGRDAAAGGAAGLHGLDRARRAGRRRCPRRSRRSVHAHRHFDQPGVANLAGQGEDLGPLALRGADRREPVAALADDRRDVGERLDVVDQRRTVPEAGFRRDRGAGTAACPAGPRSSGSAPFPRRRRTRRRRCGCRSGS